MTLGIFRGGNATGNTVTTSLGQTYNEQVELANDTTLADTGKGAINLLSIITDGTKRALTTSTGGTTTFGGSVGTAIAPLSSLTAGLAAPNNLGGTTLLKGGNVFTNGAQTYNDAVTLGATTALSAGTGAVTFALTLGSVTAPQALTITTSGVTTFDGVVGGTPGGATTGVTVAPALASLSVLGGGTVAINGGSVTTVPGPTGVQTYGGPVVLGADTLFQAYSASFGGAITSNGANAPFSLTLDFFSQTTLPGSGTFTGIRNLIVDGPGGVALSGSLTTAGDQTYSNGVVTLTGNTTLVAGNTIATGSITLNSNVVDGTPGTHSLTLVSGTSGGVTINAPVGGSSAPLASLTATARTTNGSTPTADEPVTIDATSVTTTGSQTYGTLTLGGTGLSTLISTATTGTTGITSGAVTGNGNPLTVNENSVEGGSTFAAINGAGALNFNVDGVATFNGPITAASLTATGGSGVTLKAGHGDDDGRTKLQRGGDTRLGHDVDGPGHGGQRRGGGALWFDADGRLRADADQHGKRGRRRGQRHDLCGGGWHVGEPEHERGGHHPDQRGEYHDQRSCRADVQRRDDARGRHDAERGDRGRLTLRRRLSRRWTARGRRRH